MRHKDMSIKEAAAALPATLSAEHLPDDVVTLKSMVLELATTLHQERRDHEAVRHRLHLLLQRLYGPRGERYDPNQPLLFAELAEPSHPEPAAQATAASPEKKKRRCKPHGRRRMPADLPREAHHHELTAAERLCPTCGQTRLDIGVDKSEQLEYRPAALRVIEHLVHKYACPCCGRAQRTAPGPSLQQSQEPEPTPLPASATLRLPAVPTDQTPGESMEARPASTPPEASANNAAQVSPAAATPRPGVVVAASKPTMPIPKGLPGPGLLAHLIVSKCVDHLPLYRLERVYERQGVVLPRSTLCDWMAASAQLLRPLYQRLLDVVLASRVLHTDDTPVKMQDRKHHLLTARLWVYLGDREHPYNVFDFTLNRKRDGPRDFLKNYQGYLQADAFSGYDCLYLPEPRDGVARIIEVACNAHARRKFYEARQSDDMRAHLALGYYRALYELERQAQGYDEAIRLRIRQDLEVPILEQFRTWLEKERAEVLPKSPMAEAIGYALNNWTALVRYTEAGFLAIDNNVAEREMKKIAIGRKNWLFVGSPQGGRTAAVLYSFTSTCQRLGVEPWAYLQDVLTRLPTMKPEQLSDLLPDRWESARCVQRAMASLPAPTNQPLIPSAE